MDKTTYLGLDFGDRRVGIAISDWEKAIAFPRGFLEYESQNVLINHLKNLCQEEGVKKIILGLPIHMDGRVGERAEKTKIFAEQLKKYLSGIELIYFDERLSTEYARQVLYKQGISSKDQKGKRDALSAQIILQNYLNSQSTK